MPNPAGMMVPSFDTLAFVGGPGWEMPYTNSDGTYGVKKRLYNATGSALVVGRCYIEAYDGDEETNPKIVVLDSVATNQRRLCVALEAVAASAYGWFAIEGIVESCSTVGTTDIDTDHYLKGPTSFTAALGYSLIDDGTAETINSVAIACAANHTDTVGTMIRVFLLGKPKVISA